MHVHSATDPPEQLMRWVFMFFHTPSRLSAASAFCGPLSGCRGVRSHSGDLHNIEPCLTCPPQHQTPHTDYSPQYFSLQDYVIKHIARRERDQSERSWKAQVRAYNEATRNEIKTLIRIHHTDMPTRAQDWVVGITATLSVDDCAAFVMPRAGEM